MSVPRNRLRFWIPLAIIVLVVLMIGSIAAYLVIWRHYDWHVIAYLVLCIIVVAVFLYFYWLGGP
jgi:hypothetical protein